MKTLYIECNMGAAGDMLMAALLELVPDADDFISRINHLGIPGVSITKEISTKCGINGTHVRVAIHDEEEHSLDVHHHEDDHHHTHPHEHAHHHTHEHHSHDTHEHTHSHTGIADIRHLLSHLHISDKVRQDALAVYQLIAEAEAHAHGKSVEQVHFHEVGNMDAVADVVGVCLLMEQIAPEQIICSPIHVGSGQVKCAHGILPVPAPATAHILQNIPTYSGHIQGELCTPTGAALLRHFSTTFGSQPIMRVQHIGYGMGQKDFSQANCVRIFLGETENGNHDTVSEISCNLDDMTGEAIGYAQELLLQNGALDVYTMPIQMKKSRPGVLLCCLCHTPDTDKFAQLMLSHTTSLGVRISTMERRCLDRHFTKATTRWGDITIKHANGNGITKTKPEYEDVARIASEQDVPLQAVIDSFSNK